MTKILFVCSGNVARSQIAEAFYNHLTGTKDAFSAGTNPDTPKKFPNMPKEICLIMSEEGIDISNQRVKLIDKDMVYKAENIFVMCEKECCPDFLKDSDKVIYWQINDPYQMSLDKIRNIRNKIKIKVRSII